jgi:hypothetical protein
VDSHRKFSPDEPDAQGNEPERGYSDPEWDRPGGDHHYVPAPSHGGAVYGPSSTYGAPVQPYDDNPTYRDFPVQAEPRIGYQPFDGQPPYPALADTGGPRSADGAVLGMPIGPRSGEHLPPLPPAFVAEPAPPAFVAEPAAPAFPSGLASSASAAPMQTSAPPGFSPEAPAGPGTVHTAPTSGLPYLPVDGAFQPAGRPPPVADARPGSGRTAWSGGDQADETQVVRHATEAFDRAALRRPTSGSGQVGAGSGPLGDGVYRSRRSGTAVAIVVVTVLFELMAVRLFASAFLASKVEVGGSIASSLLVLGLPMFAFGLYGLLTGAAAAPAGGLRVWLRPPLVYLPVALTLFVTAGLAA